jgi:Fic/DOC family
MPNWDDDSSQLRENLAEVLEGIAGSAKLRETPTVEAARHWQTLFMEGLNVADARYVGSFRGEPGIENVQVTVGANRGVHSSKVAEELKHFESTLQAIVVKLDDLMPLGQEPDADQLAAILDICAWVHAEWIRIHPFANGNGRTARLWANSIAMRYSLPPFVRLRPRPDAGYGAAGTKAMQGEWRPTVIVFRRLLDDFLEAV